MIIILLQHPNVLRFNTERRSYAAGCRELPRKEALAYLRRSYVTGMSQSDGCNCDSCQVKRTTWARLAIDAIEMFDEGEAIAAAKQHEVAP